VTRASPILLLFMMAQKIDVIAADSGRSGGSGKKALWQLSDESEVSPASADEDDAGEEDDDDDDDDDSSADSCGGVGSAVTRKPRPAKSVALSANDAERRQQRQVTVQRVLKYRKQ
jgi:hypothetical protein